MASMHRAVLVRRFLLLLGDLQNFQLQPENRKARRDGQPRPAVEPRYKTDGKSWYPAVEDLDEKMKSSVTAAFTWKNRGGAKGWAIRITEGGVERPLVPGSQDFLVWTVRVGYQMFEAYDVKFDTAEKVMTAMCQLLDIVVSKRCMSFELGSRLRGLDGRWELARVDAAILKCIVKCKLLRNAELQKLQYFLGSWRKFAKAESCAIARPAAGAGSVAEPAWGSDERARFTLFCNTCADECLAKDKALMSRTLLLLVEWDQPGLVVAMLRDISEQSINLLHEALQLSIVHNNPMIATSALELGANTAVYNLDAARKTSSENSSDGSRMVRVLAHSMIQIWLEYKHSMVQTWLKYKHIQRW
jgi:hypothetical protein